MSPSCCDMPTTRQKGAMRCNLCPAQQVAQDNSGHCTSPRQGPHLLPQSCVDFATYPGFSGARMRAEGTRSQASPWSIQTQLRRCPQPQLQWLSVHCLPGDQGHPVLLSSFTHLLTHLFTDLTEQWDICMCVCVCACVYPEQQVVFLSMKSTDLPAFTPMLRAYAK